MMTKTNTFQCKQFKIDQDPGVMAVGTDGMLLGAWSRQGNPIRILDVGTGSGLIALMLAQGFPTATVTGIDIDKEAVQCSEKNAKNSKFANRIEVQQASVQDFADQHAGSFDLVVCNPPFFNRPDLYANVPRQNMRNQVRLPHGELLQSTAKLLSNSGRFNCILPHLEGMRFGELAEQYGFFVDQVCYCKSFADSPIKRVLFSFLRKSTTPSQQELVIYSSEGIYSEDYTKLTDPYYLGESE